MRCLLDTHTFLWFITGDPRMSVSAKQIILDPAITVILSIATPWEIAIKVGIKKLALNEPFEIAVPREIARNQFAILPITLDHTFVVATLPHHHRDPFDRILVAQAMVEGVPIVSTDAVFDTYGITRLW
jgi:PIN domain nuclease of toxin-antitoxin system